MTRYLVDVYELVHTCPGDPSTPHPVDTRQVVVEVDAGGPCQQPLTVHCGDTTTVVDCGRRLPTDRQCAACRPVVDIRTVTTVDSGFCHGEPASAPSGLAKQPCRRCGLPLAAQLAESGVHLLCRPRQVVSR